MQRIPLGGASGVEGAEAELVHGVGDCGEGAGVSADGDTEIVVVLGTEVAAGDLGGDEAVADVGCFGEGVGFPGGASGLQRGGAGGGEDEVFIDDTLFGFDVIDKCAGGPAGSAV